MNKSNELDDIFKAMEEIDLLSEKRKKDKEILILDKDQEVVPNTKISNEGSIPSDTEKLIQQAENYLVPFDKKWFTKFYFPDQNVNGLFPDKKHYYLI